MLRKTTVKVLILAMATIAALPARAQINEQRVYLWDVSESLVMKRDRGGTEMWNPLKKQLKDAISAVKEDPANKIVLIRFYSSAFDKMERPATAEGKRDILHYIDGVQCKPQGNQKTNIVDALDAFYKEASGSPNFRNYMFLYTDGMDDYNGKEKFQKSIRQWNDHAKGHPYYGFYVLVDPVADKDSLVSIPAKGQENFWIVRDANVAIKTIAVAPLTTINVRDDRSADIKVTGDIDEFKPSVKLVADDPYYSISFEPHVSDGYIRANVTPKAGIEIPVEYEVNVGVAKGGTDDEYSFVVPQAVKLRCINKPERTLQIKIK